MTENYLYIIVALLPLAGMMVVLQDDPYHALVIRGILGAIAAMSYAVLGAADVALTEALVGTTLAITLYAIAVRSSLVMRLGILKDGPEVQSSPEFAQLNHDLRTVLNKRHLRLELLPYDSSQSLQRALMEREVHGICDRKPELAPGGQEFCSYHTTLRVQRLYEILHNELPAKLTSLSYVDISARSQPDVSVSNRKTPDLEESHP